MVNRVITLRWSGARLVISAISALNSRGRIDNCLLSTMAGVLTILFGCQWRQDTRHSRQIGLITAGFQDMMNHVDGCGFSIGARGH